MSGIEPNLWSIRRAASGDEATLRDIRLRALRESPEAFGSTYEKELARTTADWQRWLSPGATFILEDAAGARGIVAGVHDETDPAVGHLMAMWVCPALRGSGAADALVAAVFAWAKSQGAVSVLLKVIQGNDRARDFYERVGFRNTGQEEIRQRDGLIEIQMKRLVRHPSQE